MAMDHGTRAVRVMCPKRPAGVKKIYRMDHLGPRLLIPFAVSVLLATGTLEPHRGR
jgi:hypothetical protein